MRRSLKHFLEHQKAPPSTDGGKTQLANSKLTDMRKEILPAFSFSTFLRPSIGKGIVSNRPTHASQNLAI